MKKSLLLLLPVVISGCTTRPTRYDNVAYEYNADKICYVVSLNDKKYDVELKNTFVVYVDQYLHAKDDYDHLAINSFYITQVGYKLVFYKLNK